MRLWLFGVEDNIANASGQGRVIPPDSTLTTRGASFEGTNKTHEWLKTKKVKTREPRKTIALKQYNTKPDLHFNAHMLWFNFVLI